LSAIVWIALKELRSTAREPYVVIYLLLPFLALPLCVWGGIQFAVLEKGRMEQFPPKVTVTGSDDLSELLEKQGLEPVDGEPQELLDGTAQLAVEAEQLGPILKVKLHHDSGNRRSQWSLRKAKEAMRELRQLRWEQLAAERGLDSAIVAPLTIEKKGIGLKESGLFGRFIPLILAGMALFSVVLGSMYPAISVVVMEREHSSLEATLALPVPAWQHIVGKWLACTFWATATGFLGVLGIVLTLLQLEAGLEATLFVLPTSLLQLLGAGLMLLCAAGFSAAFAMLISAPAPNFAEGEALVQSVVMLTLDGLVCLGLYGVYSGTGASSFVPIAGVAPALDAALAGELEPSVAICVLCTHLLGTLFCLLPVTWLFRREAYIVGRTALRDLLPWRSQ